MGRLQTSPPESVTVYDSLGKAHEKTVTRIAWDIAAAEKGGYDHFMLKGDHGATQRHQIHH